VAIIVRYGQILHLPQLAMETDRLHGLYNALQSPVYQKRLSHD